MQNKLISLSGLNDSFQRHESLTQDNRNNQRGKKFVFQNPQIHIEAIKLKDHETLRMLLMDYNKKFSGNTSRKDKMN